MNRPRDHHFVPQFYLAGWCNSGGRLTLYFRPHTKVTTSLRTPKSTGYETDLYSFREVPETERQRMESEFMTKLDNAAAPVLEKMLSGQAFQMTPAERSDFTRFVMSLRARHPDAVGKANEQGDEALSIELARNPEEYAALKGDDDPPTLTEFAKQAMPYRVANIGISVLAKLIVDDEIGARIFSMDWWVPDVRNASTDLLTCDRPCLLVGDARHGQCVIALPLSPHKVLFISNDAKQRARLQALRATPLVKILNRAVVTSAAKYVYGTGAHHLPLVEKWLGKSAAVAGVSRS